MKKTYTLLVVLAASGLKMVGVPALPVLGLLAAGCGVILVQQGIAKRRRPGGEAADIATA